MNVGDKVKLSNQYRRVLCRGDDYYRNYLRIYGGLIGEVVKIKPSPTIVRVCWGGKGSTESYYWDQLQVVL